MYNRARHTGKESDWNKYYNLKKTAQHECHLTYSNYISNPEIKNKKIWSFIKSQCQDLTGIPPLHIDENTIDDDLEKTKILNNQFASVFTRENTNMLPTLSGTPFPYMQNIEFTIQGVLLSNLKPNKASGPDKIAARFLKEMASVLALSLTLIFKASLAQGILPDDWKKAFVIPVYKTGDRSCAANYRPSPLPAYHAK